MAGRGPVYREAADMGTGEIRQMAMFGDDEVDAPPPREKKKAPRYDWMPYPGRHVNLGKTLMRMVWHKDSGYDQNARDVFGFYVAHSPEGSEPLRLTYKEISEVLGIRQDTVSKAVAKLHAGGLLLKKEKVGRMTFFSVNPRAAFDGTALDQLAATRDTRFPVVPAPGTKAPQTTTRTRRKAS